MDTVELWTIVGGVFGIMAFAVAMYPVVSCYQISLKILPWGFHRGRKDAPFIAGGSVDVPFNTEISYFGFKLTNTGEKPIDDIHVVVYEPSWAIRKHVYGSFDSQYVTFEPSKTKYVFVSVWDGKSSFTDLPKTKARIKIKVGFWTLRSKTFPLDQTLPSTS